MGRYFTLYEKKAGFRVGWDVYPMLVEVLKNLDPGFKPVLSMEGDVTRVECAGLHRTFTKNEAEFLRVLRDENPYPGYTDALVNAYHEWKHLLALANNRLNHVLIEWE